MNPVLAAGQLIVSVALILSVLLQARGAGLSGAFGGDSAVYRSRRGSSAGSGSSRSPLLVLFVLFSMASYLLDKTVA